MDFTKLFNDIGKGISDAVVSVDNAGYDLLRAGDDLLFGGLRAVFGQNNEIVNNMAQASADATDGLQNTFGLDSTARGTVICGSYRARECRR